MISLQDGRKELFQWDTNRYIVLDNQIGDVAEIHFANGVFNRSIDVKVEEGKALIPDVLLQYARPLRVWTFVGGASNGYTKVEHVFKVNGRNKPSDYVFTPTEQLSLQELVEKFEDFKDSIGNEIEEYLKENPVDIVEKDPTVPQWAKLPNKPTYTAAEVGARSDRWLPTLEEIGAQPKGNYATKDEIPQIPEAPVVSVNGKTGDVKLYAEDVGALSKETKIITTEDVTEEIKKYMQENPSLGEESDPTVPEWAKQPEPPTFTLPVASADTLGGVKIGEGNLSVSEDGKADIKPEFTHSLVDRLTTSFSVTGEKVVCYPVAGYPLDVVAHIAPKQEGSGDSSPINKRPVSGCSEINLTVQGGDKKVTYSAKFGQTIYGGKYNLKTGKLTATWAKVAAADAGWSVYGSYGYGARFITQFFDHFPDDAESVTKVKANFCPAVFVYDNAPYQGKTFLQFSSGSFQTSLYVAQSDVGAGVELTLDNVKSWLRSIDAYIVYTLKTPMEIQLTPQQILSLDGENALWSDCGDITVSGPTEPKFRDEQQDIKIEEIADKTGVIDVMFNMVKQITDVESGTWENGQKRIDDRRLRSREYYKVRAGTVVSFVPNGLYIYVHVYPDAPSNAAQTMLEASGWLGGSGEEIRYKIKNDGYAVFLFANGENWNASQTIYPENYVSKTGLLLYMADISNAEKLPAYWTKHISEKIPEVNANSAACAMQGDSFIFFTDYHLEQTAGFSHLLMQDIVSKTSVRKVIFGGDIFNGAETHAGALEKTRVFIERFGGLNVCGIRGNHEYNLLDGGSVAERLTDSEIYNVTLKGVEDRVTTNGALSCYFDNTNRKIRYILIDSHQENESDIITEAELEWLKARMTELESGWTVMVFTHVMFIVTDKATATVSYLSNGQRIVNAIKSVKDSMAATLACLICGHAHFDYSSTDNGFLLVSTTCDSKQDSGQWIGWGQGAGTTAEHAFDVFSLDTVSRSLRAVRIGRGENREWNY